MNTSRILQSSALVLAVVAASISGCSDDSATGGSPATGGTAGKSTGGGSSGGVSATGGKSSTGGSSSGGATGGSKATGGTSSGGAAAGGTNNSGGASATGGAGNVGVAGFPGTCTLESADASAKGKTCNDFCTAWNFTGDSCHDIKALTTLFSDGETNAECITECQTRHTETQFCCRMQHVLLSLGPDGTGQPAKDPTLAVHCDHAAGLSVCP